MLIALVDVAGAPFARRAHVDDRLSARGARSLAQLAGADEFERWQLGAPAVAPRLEAAVEVAGDGVEAHAQQLPARLVGLRGSLDEEHKLASPRGTIHPAQ